MFLIIGLVLLGVWLIGFGLFRAVVGGVIHVVLVLAVIALAWHFVSSGRRASSGGGSSALDPNGAAGRARWSVAEIGGHRGQRVVV